MSIRQSLTSGVLYTAAAKYSSVLIQLFIGAVLARLLTPNEFGIVALVTVFVTFFSLISSFGIAPAIIQNISLKDREIQSIFLFTIILGVLLAGLFFLSAPLIARFYSKVELVNIARLLSLSILFNTIQIVPSALYQKALKFKQIGIITIIVQLIVGLVSIILAYSGLSYYALVINSILTGALLMVIYYWLSPIGLPKKVELTGVRKIMKFSVFQFMFNFINFFSRNSDNLLIGKFLGSAPLGYYDKSYRLMLMPVQNLTHVITPVLMPVLSKHQMDKTVVFNAYMKVVKVLAMIGFPLSFYLYFNAEEIIYIIYGPQWAPSIPVFKILSLTVCIQMILSSAGSIFQVVNRTDLLFYSGILGTVLMIGGITYGLFIGKSIEAVGYGLLFAFILNFGLAFYLLIKISLRKSLLEFFKKIAFPLLTGLILGLTLMLTGHICPKSIVYSLLLKSLVAGIVIIILYWFNRDSRDFIAVEIKNWRRQKDIIQNNEGIKGFGDN